MPQDVLSRRLSYLNRYLIPKVEENVTGSHYEFVNYFRKEEYEVVYKLFGSRTKRWEEKG